MKRILPLLLLIISLYGCNVKEPLSLECIADSLHTKSAPAFYLEADIPIGAVLSASCDDGCCALYSHEDYEIYQEVFSAASLDNALLHVSGQAALSAICTSNFPFEQYRFRWLCAGENGTTVCNAKLIFDGEYYHCLSIHCPMQLQTQYETVFSDLLSSAAIVSV